MLGYAPLAVIPVAATPLGASGVTPPSPFAGLVNAVDMSQDYLIWDNTSARTTIDMSLDFLTWANLMSVTYESVRGRASIVDVPPVYDGSTPAPTPPTSPANVIYDIAVAKRRPTDSHEASPSEGTVIDDDCVWIIPDVMFPAGVTSKAGDVIVEKTTQSNEEQPGTRWIVRQAQWNKHRWTRRLTCRNARIMADLQDVITIERPKITYDAAGCAVKQFPSDATNPAGVVLYANLPARVQLVAKPEEDEMGIRGSAGRYEVTVANDVNVTREDRIKLTSGVYLDILDMRSMMTLDALMVLECRRKV